MYGDFNNPNPTAQYVKGNIYKQMIKNTNIYIVPLVK